MKLRLLFLFMLLTAGFALDCRDRTLKIYEYEIVHVPCTSSDCTLWQVQKTLVEERQLYGYMRDEYMDDERNQKHSQYAADARAELESQIQDGAIPDTYQQSAILSAAGQIAYQKTYLEYFTEEGCSVTPEAAEPDLPEDSDQNEASEAPDVPEIPEAPEAEEPEEPEIGEEPEVTEEPEPEVTGEPEQPDLEDELPDDYFETEQQPNTYEVIEIDGKKVIKFKDIYGNVKYTSDGKHFYDDYGVAAAPGPFREAWNGINDAIGDFKDFFFKTKFSDKEKELKTEIAREVLRDFKSEGEKKIEKKHGEITGKLVESATEFVQSVGGKPAKKVMELASVPADAVIDFANEASETDFAQGARYYITEREAGRSSDDVYESPPVTLEGGYGGMYGIGQGTASTFPKALMFAKYEEVYQRYRLAKELGRR